MHATVAQLTAPRELQFRREDLPSPGQGELLCETEVSVISPGTELAAWRGDPPLRPMKVYPRLVGYCNVARVREVGQGVEDLQPGDRVVNYSSHRSAFVAPAARLGPLLRPGDDPVAMATTYLYHLGYNALLKGGFTPGMSVAVIGLGVLGQGAVELAAGSGGEVVALSGVDAFRQRARSRGARAVAARELPAARAALREAVGAEEADLCITTSNRWEDWRLALEVVRREGTVAVLGFPGRGEPDPDFNPVGSRWFYDKQLRLIAAGFSPNVDLPAHDLRFTQPRNMRWLAGQVRRGDLEAGSLVSGILPAGELAAAYQRLEAREEPLLTLALSWEGEA